MASRLLGIEGNFRNEGPTENHQGELGSLFKYYNFIIIFVDLTHSTISACNNFMCFIQARFGSKGNFPCLLHKLSQCLVEKQEA